MEQTPKRREMTLRLPADLKERLERIAQANKRSLTREIELALEEYANSQALVDNDATRMVS